MRAGCGKSARVRQAKPGKGGDKEAETFESAPVRDTCPARPRPSPSRNRVLRETRRRKREAYTGSMWAVSFAPKDFSSRRPTLNVRRKATLPG
jgi:hypothetical protein